MEIQNTLRYVEAVLVSFWVGTLLSIGIFIAPVIFATVESRSEAGNIAAHIFEALTFMSMIVGPLLLVISHFCRPKWYRRAVWSVIIMIGAIAFMHFGIGYLMDIARERNADGAVFMQLHGVAVLFYLIAAIAGLVLLAKRRPSAIVL